MRSWLSVSLAPGYFVSTLDVQFRPYSTHTLQHSLLHRAGLSWHLLSVSSEDALIVGRSRLANGGP